MKFAILSDIHMGPERYWKGVLRKINKDVEIFLNDFVEEMNNNVKPEFVVVLGDLIEDEDKSNDIKNMKSVINLLNKLKCQVYYVAGNHDLTNLSEDEVKNLFNQKELYYSFDKGEFHFIVLFAELKGNAVPISDEQKEWLQKDLNKTKKKCIIFTHRGLAEQDLKENIWFKDNPEWALIPNRNEIKKILETSNKVIAVFNGHLHWDKKHVENNIPHFTIQSLIENEEDKGIASEAYAIVDITEDNLGVEIKGNYSKKL